MPPSPNFDRVARLYRWAEYLSLGTQLERTREYHLPALTDRRHALILGDGDGRFLAHLLRQNPALQAIAIDTSATMLKLLRSRCSFATDRLQTQQISALTVDVSADTDLVTTHFLLDCFTQPDVDALTRRLAAQLAPGAVWLVSDFAIPTAPLLRPLARLYVRGLYLAFSLLAGLRTTHLPDPQSSLSSAGFVRIGRQERLFGLLYTELWQRQ
jgi:ubiquinone/menaquinone biosynthesis C-methylase UbiE